MKTLVLGLGNPLLGDDSVGWVVAAQVGQKIKPGLKLEPGVEVDCLAIGGLSLMERLIGYDRAILIDAISTRQQPPGTVRAFPFAQLPNLAAEHMTSAHDTSLQTALQVGKSMGAQLPADIQVVCIESIRTYDFSEELTLPVAKAVPQAVQAVMHLLKEGQFENNCIPKKE